MKKIIAISILLISQIGHAWEAKELTQEVPVEGTQHLTYTLSSIQFKSSTGETVIFKPSVEPYALAEIKKYTFDDVDYFLTTWVAGSSSVFLRVFRPDVSELPLCQESSDAEEAEIRKTKDMIELSVTKKSNADTYKELWAKCYKHSKDRKVNNVPKEKGKKAKIKKK